MTLLIGFLATAFAQGQSLSFDAIEHDFGLLDQKKVVNYRFAFQNIGSDTLQIISVTASCGCTTSGWTSGRIAPMDTGSIHVRFDPANRPGKFSKSLQVVLNNDEQKALVISGEVLPGPDRVGKDFPYEVGDLLRTRTRILNLGTQTTEKPVTRSFDVFNMHTDTLAFQEVEFPSYLHLDTSQAAIPPGQAGRLGFHLYPDQANFLGFRKTTLTLQVIGQEKSDFKLDLALSLTEYFPPMTEEELSRAPKLELSRSSFDFGSLSASSGVGELTLYNRGSQPLNIRDVQSNCDCLTFQLAAMDIAPGDSTRIELTFDPEKRRGRQYKTLTFFSNDPSASVQVVSIKAAIVH